MAEKAAMNEARRKAGSVDGEDVNYKHFTSNLQIDVVLVPLNGAFNNFIFGSVGGYEVWSEFILGQSREKISKNVFDWIATQDHAPTIADILREN